MSENVEFLSDSMKDLVLEQLKYKQNLVMRSEVPCPCHWCDNWIDKTELFWRIGENNEHVLCMDCAKPIIKRLEECGGY